MKEENRNGTKVGLLTMLVIAWVSPALAGNDAGHGGSGIACFEPAGRGMPQYADRLVTAWQDSNGGKRRRFGKSLTPELWQELSPHLLSVEVFDLWLARREQGADGASPALIQPGSGETAESYSQRIIKRIGLASTLMGGRFQKNSEFLSKVKWAWVDSGVDRIDNDGEDKDEQVPGNCAIVTIASRDQGTGEIRADKRLKPFLERDDLNKKILLLHEVAYQSYIERTCLDPAIGAKTCDRDSSSRSPRALVSKAVTQEITANQFREIAARLGYDVGLSFAHSAFIQLSTPIDSVILGGFIKARGYERYREVVAQVKRDWEARFTHPAVREFFSFIHQWTLPENFDYPDLLQAEKSIAYIGKNWGQEGWECEKYRKQVGKSALKGANCADLANWSAQEAQKFQSARVALGTEIWATIESSVNAFVSSVRPKIDATYPFLPENTREGMAMNIETLRDLARESVQRGTLRFLMPAMDWKFGNTYSEDYDLPIPR